MKKSVIINVYKKHKFISWYSNSSILNIQGFDSKKDIDIWLEFMFAIYGDLCVFGSFNKCNNEIINRILKAEEIL